MTLALVRMSIAGGANVSGGQAALGGQTVQLSAASAAFWAVAGRWEIFAYPVGFSEPAGWSTNPDNNWFYYLGTTPPVINLPAAPFWGKWLFRLAASDGTTTDIDEASGVSVVSPSGLLDIAVGEGAQFGAAREWVAALAANMRVLDGVVIEGSVRVATFTAAFGTLYRCNPSGGGFTVNLPTAVGKAGQGITVKNTTSSTNAITLDATGAELIDGLGTYALNTAYGKVTVISDGANWMAF